MFTSKHIFSVILAALLLSGTVVSCGSPAVEETESVLAAETVPAETEPTLEDEIALQYADADYAGDDFQILSIAPGGKWYNNVSPTMNEIWFESMTGEAYSDAVYTRNILTEELLNIRIKPDYAAASFPEFEAPVKQRVLAGDTDMDAALGSLSFTINLAAAGHMTNLFRVDTMELDKPWYDPNIILNYGYKGEKLYAVTGAYNVYDDLSAPMILYGKQIMTEHGLQDPAELVIEGTWTVDNMMTMAETATVDLNGDGSMTLEHDSFGLMDNGDVLIHFMEGAAQPITVRDSDGIPVVNTLTENYVDIAEHIFNRVIASPGTKTDSNSLLQPLFEENRALFYVSILACISDYRDMESDFSLLPMPKHSEEQENYVAPINSTWCTALSIPVSVVDVERTGTILNVLSAFSLNTVDKALHEMLLGAKLIRDEETRTMLDFVMANKQYCWGNGYNWSGRISQVLRNQVTSQSFTVASGMQSISASAVADLQKFLDSIEKLP